VLAELAVCIEVLSRPDAVGMLRQNSAIVCAQNFVHNWPSCTRAQRRNGKILHILCTNIALSSALTAGTVRIKHFGVKVIK